MLYVTSFNEQIFKLSGLRLLDTYLSFIQNSVLLVCYEDKDNTGYLDAIINRVNGALIFYKLSDDVYLNNWLNENKDLIPTEYGGECTQDLDQWNIKASLWFRKIASLNYVHKNYSDNTDYIIWIDADCFFMRDLPSTYVISQFNDTYCFYHLGKWRYENNQKSIESGFMGFKKGDGYILLKEIIDEFSDKKFIKYSRWDDGHVMGQIITSSNIKSVDLVGCAPRRTTWDVIDKGPFKTFVVHNKGCHHSKKKENIYKIIDFDIMYANVLDKLR